MLVSEIIDEIRQEANTNSAKASNTYLLTGINLDYGEVIMQILRAKTDFSFQGGESYTNHLSTSGLVAGQSGFNGEYTFPTDLIRPIRVEISYDGEVWRPAKFYDVADTKTSETDEDDTAEGQWSQSSPYVRFERESMYVRPVNTGSTVTAGIRVWFEKRQSNLEIGSTPNFEANFHRILVLRGALRLMRKYRKQYNLADRNELRGELNNLTEELLSYYKDRFKKQFQLRPAALSMN